MKRSLSVLALLPGVIQAQSQEAWLEIALQEREATLNTFAENRQRVDETLLRLIDEIPAQTENADETLPEGEPGETVAVADGGMLFDVVNARMVYINNVRVNDPRLQMRCADRLYIQLPKGTLDEGKQEAKDALKPATEPTEAAPSTASDATTAKQKMLPTISVDVATAMINTVQNKALLIGRTGTGHSISITQDNTHMLLKANGNTAAQAMVDTNGDIFITAGAMDMQWEDEAGNLNKLTNKGGTAYYRAKDGKIILTGESELNTPDGSICCTEEICVTLKQEARETDDDSGIMPQFGKVRIVGINGATAKGNVKAQREASDTNAAASVTGESLVYDATTGECSISGNNTTLHYAENSLATNGSIHLAPNGDITLQGDSITGAYTRPAEDKKAPALPGTFTTGGKIQFTAADGMVRIPSGIAIVDEQCEFRVGGGVEIKLAKSPDAQQQQPEKVGMINTAIASYSDIESVKATGGISLRYLQGKDKQELTLKADDADIDLVNGAATLTTAVAGCTQITYADFNLTAESTTGNTSLSLSPEGDLSMQGEKLTATIPTKEGAATVHCTDALTLVRETGRLEMGAGAHVEAPQGRLTANGPLFITLRRGADEDAKPLLPQFPHLVYNFNGLQQADTEQGGSVQSKQAAMRCSGKIHVSMSDEDTTGKAPESAIRLATAEGDVAVTGKDSTGRVMTAYGDKLTINGITGEKRLSGNKVILQDKDNTHTASGANAAVILDKKNNVRITGSKQSTSASNLRKQIEKQQNNK